MELDYFLAADPKFYEPIDRRPIDSADYVDFVKGLIDENWELAQKSVWMHCRRKGVPLPLQGWKIHVSSVPKDSRAVLEAVASHLVRNGVSFKFLADAKILKMTNAKSWSRGASGKFFTIYPVDETHFRRLLAELEPLTKGFRGPYILSDKRYKDSKVLYYRYGGIRQHQRLEVDGRQTPLLVAPDGREIEDVRNPFYFIPDWAQEPFPADEQAPEGTSLDHGRFTVEKAIHFSNSGGVYVAHDARTGQKAVLKEARAHIHHFYDDADAAEMLRHEHKILERLADAGVAPRPVELFQEWEHLFLAEEHFEGYMTLRRFSSRGGLDLDTRPTREKVQEYLREILSRLRKLAAIVEVLHARGIVWGDISVNNVLIHPETEDIKIIDLESARLDGEPALPRITTPGFGAPNRAGAGGATVEDDYYGFGAVMLFLTTHINGLVGLKPQAVAEILAQFNRDLGVPSEFTDSIKSLLDADPSRRPTPRAALDRAEACLDSIGPVAYLTDDHTLLLSRESLEETIAQTCRFIRGNADLERKDRLFPADPLVYQTGPAGLAHGAAGVLYALAKIEGRAPEALVEWTLKAERESRVLPPGLLSGRAGLAWTMVELGRWDEAERILDDGATDPLLGASPDLFDGLAGWGLANLKLWRATKKEVHLSRAQEAGRRIVASAQEKDGGLSWPGKAGLIRYGLGHGAAGIGLFLLYLDRAAGGFERHAVKALESDLSAAVEAKSGGLSWYRDSESQGTIYPYYKHGGAGIGIALLRFWKATRNRRYRELVDRIHLDCDHKNTVFPGRHEGLAGLGEFHLDAYLHTGDRKFLNSAYRAAAGLEIFRVPDPQGYAYPGNGLARLSCDLATGGAGIALFLHRLLTRAPHDFLLDEVLP